MSNLRKAIIAGMTEREALYWVENDAWCESGSVSGLIYYTDTVAFFDKHEEEILDLAQECEFKQDPAELGMTGYKNIMAWFAFEALKDSVFEECGGMYTYEEEVA